MGRVLLKTSDWLDLIDVAGSGDEREPADVVRCPRTLGVEYGNPIRSILPQFNCLFDGRRI